MCDRKRSVTSQDISTSLWSLGTLEFRDADIFRSVASRFNQHMIERAKPQELSSTLYSLALAEIAIEDRDAFDTSMVHSSDRPLVTDPVTVVFGLSGSELMRRPFDFKPQELKVF